MKMIGACYVCGRAGAVVTPMHLPFGTTKRRRNVCDQCRRAIVRGDLVDEIQRDEGPLLDHIRGRTP